jgi:SAM-dependent methyltransferase
MNPNRFKFIEQNITEDLSDKKVLEVGSRIVSGSMRGYLESLNPKEYIGIDIVPGEGVDLILDVHHTADHFGTELFDIVICSDTLEHIDDLESASYNMHSVLKIGGKLVVSVPTMETHYHGFPHDYWRFTVEDLKHVFNYMKAVDSYDTEGACVILEKQSSPYIFDSNYPIYSILRGKPITHHNFFDRKLLSLYRRYQVSLRKFFVKYTPKAIKNIIRKLLKI